MAVYEIAFHLKKTIYEIADQMTYEEFLGWLNYFERRPVGWREDSRTYKLLQVQGVKEKPWNLFETLASMKESSAPPDKNLQNSFLFQKMLSAKGGDKIL